MFFSWWCLVLVVIYGVSGADVAHEYGGVDNGDAEAESYGGRSLETGRPNFGTNQMAGKIPKSCHKYHEWQRKKLNAGVNDLMKGMGNIFGALFPTHGTDRGHTEGGLMRQENKKVTKEQILEKIKETNVHLSELENQVKEKPNGAKRYLHYY